MVMNAIGKPHLLQIFLQTLEVLGVLVSLVPGIDFFESGADCKILFTVLVKQNVATLECSLGEVIHKLLLLK